MKRPLISVGGYAPTESVHSRALDHFAKTLTAESNGEVDVDILYNVLDEGHPATHLFDLVRSGELTWCYYSTSYLGDRVPALNALEVPFLFETASQAHQLLDGDFGLALAAAVRQHAGFDVLGFWDNGLRHLTNSKRSIRTPADCEGLRIRLQPNEIHQALVAAWGMEPVPAELSDGIAMIKRGEVDAQENPLANTKAYGVDHRHVTLSAHLYGARGLFANPDEMANLGQIAEVVNTAARSAIEFQRREAAAYEDAIQAEFLAEGRTVVELSELERRSFAAAAQPVTDRAMAEIDDEISALLH